MPQLSLGKPELLDQMREKLGVALRLEDGKTPASPGARNFDASFETAIKGSGGIRWSWERQKSNSI